MRLFALMIPMLAACADGGDGVTDANEDPVTIAIAGTWNDNFGTTHIIDATSWSQANTYGESTFAILDFDNERGWAVAQNGSDNGFNPDLYSRFEWVEVGPQIYFCQVLFDGATQEDAEKAGPADASDPATDGCGGYSWSELNP